MSTGTDPGANPDPTPDPSGPPVIVSPTVYVPDPTNPKNIADIFARSAQDDVAIARITEIPGLDDTTRAAVLKVFNDNKVAIDDEIADAIHADSTAKGLPVPEVITEVSPVDGSVSLYTFNADGAPGSKLVKVVPIAAELILLPNPS